MDYSLLLAVHNITEEMKSAQMRSLASLRAFTSLSEPALFKHHRRDRSSLLVHEAVTTTSTDSGITMTTVAKLPTYMQYLRVIEFVRAQQETTTSDIERRSLVGNPAETASARTMKPESSPQLSRLHEQRSSMTNVTLRANNRSPANQHVSSSLQTTSGIIGGDVWYNRQNLSRLAM